jgi:hypothetical protein
MSENEVVEWINESGGHGENTLDYLDTIIEEHPNINYLVVGENNNNIFDRILIELKDLEIDDTHEDEIKKIVKFCKRKGLKRANNYHEVDTEGSPDSFVTLIKSINGMTGGHRTKRKTHKRKTHKRKTHKRKTHKRKTHKRKTH